MKRTPLLVIWSLSFAITALFANSMNIVFWLALTAFCITSLHIEKHSERREKEE